MSSELSPTSLAPRPLAPRPVPASRLVTWLDWTGREAECYRLLAARLTQWRDSTPGPSRRALVATSSAAGEGKTVTAANLALALARGCDTRVLLIEGDLRQSTGPTHLESLWGLPHLPGLGDWIAAGEALAPLSPELIYPLAVAKLFLLPAGCGASAPLAFLTSDAASRLLATLASAFDWILVDAPALLPLAEAHAWCRLADGVLLVVRQDRTRRAVLARALRGLEPSRIAGVIVNSSREAERQSRLWPPAARLPLSLSAPHRP